MTTGERAIYGSLLAALVACVGYQLISTGLYGFTLFALLPVLVGAIGAWVTQAKSSSKAMRAGIYANLIGCAAFLLGGLEGLVCIGMALPLALPLGAFGGWLVYAATHKRTLARGTAMLAILPLGLGSLGFDATAKPHVFAVRSSIEIAAPPEVVWKHVVSFSELPPPEEWYFKSGIAYPMRARIDGTGPGAVRYCEFSTGPFVEPIEVSDEPRLLRFSVAQNPAPMNEWSPFANVVPRHLHGYLVSKQGQFLLTALPNGHTLLEGTTWYQHGLYPETYWTVWSDAIIHRIHMRVLNHIKNLSEHDG